MTAGVSKQRPGLTMLPAWRALEAHVELVRQTRGHAFLQGVVKQDGENCYSFSGTLKRVNRPNAPSR